MSAKWNYNKHHGDDQRRCEKDRQTQLQRLFKGSPQSTPHQDAELLGEEDPGDVLQTAMCQASQV